MNGKTSEKIILIFIVLSFACIPLNYFCDLDKFFFDKYPLRENFYKNLTFYDWHTFCQVKDNDGKCLSWGFAKKTQSLMFFEEEEIEVISILHGDDYYNELFLDLKYLNNGNLIEPFPQKEHKWYQLFKKYKSYETVGELIDEDGNVIIEYPVSVSRNRIIISCENWNYGSFEERNDIAQGGCSFLEDYMHFGIDNPIEYDYAIYIELNSDKTLVINLN